MRQTKLVLSDEDRQKLREVIRDGGPRSVIRALTLSNLDRGVPESTITNVLEISRVTLWRTRKSFIEGGLDKALYDDNRPGKPVVFGDDVISEIVALACSNPPEGAKRWTIRLLADEASKRFDIESISRESIRRILKKNALKPWLKKMWCIGDLTAEYRERMYNILDLYAELYDANTPVICIDEKNKQIISHITSKLPLRMKEGAPEKIDYEYLRKGTCNFFVAIEPKIGNHIVSITERRTKKDFVNFATQLVEHEYKNSEQIYIVLDNLNTHFKRSFNDILGKEKSDKLFERIILHHTPKHASWLNMAEIVIGILDRQCLSRRFNDLVELQEQVTAWLHRRNAAGTGIKWTFTKEKADKRLGKHYVS